MAAATVPLSSSPTELVAASVVAGAADAPGSGSARTQGRVGVKPWPAAEIQEQGGMAGRTRE